MRIPKIHRPSLQSAAVLDDGVERVLDLPGARRHVGGAERRRGAEGRQVQLQRELHVPVHLLETILILFLGSILIFK